jgi:Ca2+-binding RTX toxin-like protein
MAGPGSIAIVSYGTDAGTNGKFFSFVLLDPTLRGQTINFTDNGWTSAGAFRAGEGISPFAIPANAAIGTVFTIAYAGGGAFDAVAAGDQILAYIGTAASPTFLFAIQVASGTAAWAGNATTDNTSAVPTGLTNGDTALAFSTDNGLFTGPLTGDAATILAAIANEANWIGAENQPNDYVWPVANSFTVANTVVPGATPGADTLTGGFTNDTIDGLDGNDVLDGGDGDDTLFGGLLNDVLTGGSGTNTLAGNSGNDIFVISSATDTVIELAGEGTDRVETTLASYVLPANVEILEYTGAGAFTGTGNALANIIVGGAVNDTLDGGDGDDTLGGEAGDDALTGGLGNDRLNGGTGADTMDGGDGDDVLVVDDAGDVANGGAGTDTVQISAAITYTIASDIETVSNIATGNGAVVTLNALGNTYGGSASAETVNAGEGADMVYGRAGDDVLNGEAGSDRVFGDAGSDQLSGGEGNDLLYAGADNDTASGDAGNDTLYGEGGNDILIGGSGLDVLNGGLGADSFVFATGDSGATTATADRIQGFSSAQGDRIDLTSLGISSFVGTAAFSSTAGELRTQLIGGNTYVQGDVNGDGVADFMIRLDGAVALTGSDFLFATG